QFHAIRQFVDSALVGITPILKLAHWRMVERIWSENSFCLRAYRWIPRITSLRSSLRVLNRPRKYQFRLFLPLGLGARDDICNGPRGAGPAPDALIGGGP